MSPENHSSERSAEASPMEGSVDDTRAPACLTNYCRPVSTKRVIIALLLLGIIVFIIVDASTTGYLRQAILSLLEWVNENPVAGWFVFSLVYCVATILFVPGLILTLGAGFVFGHTFNLGVGIVLGTMSVFLGASTGAIIAFLLARYLLRDWVVELTKKYAIFEALDVAMKENGFRIMALLRLSPIIPFNAINYIAGATSISLRDFVLSLFAIIPGTVLYVFLGASANSLSESASSGASTSAIMSIVIIVVGIVLGIGAIFLTSYYAKKELNRILAERQAVEEEGSITREGSVKPDDTSDHNSSTDEQSVDLVDNV